MVPSGLILRHEEGSEPALVSNITLCKVHIQHTAAQVNLRLQCGDRDPLVTNNVSKEMLVWEAAVQCGVGQES